MSTGVDRRHKYKFIRYYKESEYLHVSYVGCATSLSFETMSGYQSGRCYTISHNTTKYEPSEWKGIINSWRSDGKALNGEAPYLASGPDSNGNYQIGFRNVTINVTFYCQTQYGTTSKTFSNTVSMPDISASQISVIGANIFFDDYVSSGTTRSTTLTVTIPYNCSMFISKATSFPTDLGVSIQSFSPNTWSIGSSGNQSRTVTVSALWMGSGTSTSKPYCISAELNFKVTALNNNTEYTPGSSATFTRTVVFS